MLFYKMHISFFKFGIPVKMSMETQNFDTVLNLEVVFHGSWGT